MSLRYRRSIRISKGLKLNFSKHGMSLSLGGPGASLNFSSKGTRATWGIPGSGLSYSHYISKKDNSSQTAVTHSDLPALPEFSNFHLEMNPQGRVDVFWADGTPVEDPALLKRLRSTQEYRDARDLLEYQRDGQLEMKYEAQEAEFDKVINIIELTPSVSAKEEYINYRESLQPKRFQKVEFSEEKPTVDRIQQILEVEAEENVQATVFTRNKKRFEYVQMHLQQRYNEAVDAWERQKDAFEADQEEIERETNERFDAQYQQTQDFLQQLIDGDSGPVEFMITEWISSLELPVEIDVSYQLDLEHGTVMLDVDLPEIEELPTKELKVLANGRLSEKNKTQAELKREYALMVFGLAAFISANIFNQSPAIEHIVISGYTQRRNKDGDINDDYIFSIKFVRDGFINIDFSRQEAMAFCMRFENRCNISSALTFTKIKPYEEF